MIGFDSHTGKRPSDSWFKMLAAQLERRSDTFVSLCIEIEGTPTFVPLNHYQFCKPFDAGFSYYERCHFTAWGESYVYFPMTFEGAEWIGSVPRNPELCATNHFSGEW
jgi:hypothetical protein